MITQVKFYRVDRNVVRFIIALAKTNTSGKIAAIRAVKDLYPAFGLREAKHLVDRIVELSPTVQDVNYCYYDVNEIPF